jgi:uncharacterized protein involved in exopolysaccharide biosynthesis
MNDSLNFLKPYLRGWPIILGIMLVSFLIANKYLNYVTPMYESTAKLRMADLNEGVPNSNLFKDLDVFASTQKINAEIELLKSYTLISKALARVPFEVQVFRLGSIRKTELFNDSPILIKPLEWEENLKDKSFMLKVQDDYSFIITDEQAKTYMGYLGDTITLSNSRAVFELNKELLSDKKNLKIADDFVFMVLSRARQISQINSNIDISAVDKDVPVIRISYKSSHPAKAALFPNALAEAYIEDYIENKYSAANVTVDFLNDRINEMSQKLVKSEQMILNYRDQNSITNINQETETDLRKISQLKIQQINLKMSLEAIRELEGYVQSGRENFLELAPNFEAFTDLLSTEIIKKIKLLQAEKKDLLLQYTENDEKVIVMDAKINDLTSYLIESISNTRRNLETKYAKLSEDITQAEKVFIDVPEKERMMTILNREFAIYQQSYNFLNQKKIEAEIAKAARIAFHRIITPASISSQPVSPNRIVIVIVATILGMMGAIALIFIVHSLKGRVNDLSTVENVSMIPVIAAVPKLKTKKSEEAFFIKTLAEWEVKGIVKPNGITCFTGFNHKHGVSFISARLAEIYEMQHRSVLLVQIQDDINEATDGFWKLERTDNNTSQIAVSAYRLKSIGSQQWQAFLKEKSAGFEQTFIVNSTFGQPYTVSTMSAADLNVVCLDTRLTPRKFITQVDLIKEEFSLPGLNFAINRAGYNPSFIRESIQFSMKGINVLKNHLQK